MRVQLEHERVYSAWLPSCTGISTKSTEGTTAVAQQNANQNLLLLRTLSASPLAFSKANAHATVCPLLPLLVHCVTDACLIFHTDMRLFLKICGLLSLAGLLISAYVRISHLWLPQATFVLINQTDPQHGHVCVPTAVTGLSCCCFGQVLSPVTLDTAGR